MEQSTASHQEEKAIVSLAQRLSSRLLSVDWIRQRLSSASLSLSDADAALLLAYADMLCYQNSWLGDSSLSAPMLTGLRSPDANPPLSQLSPAAGAPHSPLLTSSASIPSSKPDTSASPSSDPFHSTIRKDLAAQPRFHLTETLVQKTSHTGSPGGGNAYTDASEVISPTAVPQFPKACALPGVRSSDSSTCTMTSTTSSSSCHRSSVGRGEGQQQRSWCASSTSSCTPWTLGAPGGDRVRPVYDEEKDGFALFRSNVPPQGNCGERATSSSTILSAATDSGEISVAQQRDERELHPSFTPFTESEHDPFFRGSTTRTSLPRENSQMHQLYEATPPSIYRDQQRQQMPQRRIATAACAAVDSIFNGSPLESRSAYLPLRDSSVNTNKSHAGNPPVSRFPTTTLSYSEVAHTLAHSHVHDSPVEHGSAVSMETNQRESFSNVSSDTLKTLDHIKKYSLQGIVQFQSYKNHCAQEKATIEVDQHAFSRKGEVPQKPHTLETPASHVNAGESFMPAVQEGRREKLQRTVEREKTNPVWPENRPIMDGRFLRIIQDTEEHSGLKKNTQQHKIQKKPEARESERQKSMEKPERHGLGNQDEGEAELDSKKIEEGEKKDYLQMAKKLPKLAGVIFDRLHKRWVSTYHDKETRKVMRKYFGVRKHGFEHAYRMAVKHRKMKMLARQPDCDQFAVMQRDRSHSNAYDATGEEKVEDVSVVSMAQNKEVRAEGEALEEAEERTRGNREKYGKVLTN